MIFLIAFASALIFVFLFSSLLRKHAIPFYLAAAAVSTAVVFCTWNRVTFPGWFETWIWPLFARGAFAGALFIVVMWTGALPGSSTLFKRFMPVRAQLSILACILTFGHNIAYGKTYFTALFFSPSRMSLPTLIAAVCSLLMIVIMLPLFVTSFMPVRRKMEPKSWKRLQRFAYLFYALLYCHVMLLAIPNAIKGRSGYSLTVFVYSFVFLSYAFCRIIKAIAVREKATASLALKQSMAILCSAVISALILSAVLIAGEVSSLRDELESLQAPASTESADEETAAAEVTDNTAEDPKITDPTTGTASGSKYKNGIFTGSAKGNHGSGKDVEVAVEIENDRILSIEITGFRDDEEYFSPSIEGADMIGKILDKQSPYVDVITGATETSEGLIRAVSAALREAGK